MKVAKLETKKQLPSDIYSLISTARANNCWIYFEKNKTFYTPEEMEKRWEEVYYSYNKGNNFKDFKIVSPLYAIRLVSQWVDVANTKQKEIIEKLAKYSAEFSIKK